MVCRFFLMQKTKKNPNYHRLLIKMQGNFIRYKNREKFESSIYLEKYICPVTICGIIFVKKFKIYCSF